jgi:uncharacterized protein
MMSNQPGRFVWYELMTRDPQNNLDFYRNVVGWGTQNWDAGATGQPYTMWLAGPVPVAGTMELPPEARDMGARPHWLTYMSTLDLDESVALARQLGGRVQIEELVVPTVGRIGVFQDPHGAWFAMLEPESAMDMTWTPDVGRFSWNELMTTDVDAAFAFYSKLMGWKETQSMDMGPHGKYLIFGAGTTGFGGMYNRMPGMGDRPANWLPYVRVADLDAAMSAVTSNGGSIHNGPMDVPGGRVSQCADHQGAAFALHEIA